MLSMMSLSKISGANRGEYYVNLGREDYYFNGGEPKGKWQGNGASILGLNGEVERTELKAMMLGVHPFKYHKLVQNAGDANRQSAWDLTFSAPKSVSVAWSQASPELAKQFQEAQRVAVQKALAYLETSAAYTRRGKDGVIKEKCSLVFATFEHGTSRAQDPQIHTHALVINVSIRDDGTTGTIVSKPFYLHQMATSAIYRQELSYQIYKRLGLQSHNEKNWFELNDIPKDLIEEFSKRRQEIEEQARLKKVVTAKGYEIANLATRTEKQVVAREELFKRWQTIGQDFKFSTNELTKLIEKSKEELKPYEGIQLAEKSVNKVSFNNAYFSKREIQRYAAEFGQAKNIASDEILKAVDIHLKNSDKLVNLGIFNDEEIYSTKENIALEKELIEIANESTVSAFHVVNDQKVDSVIKDFSTLTAEQINAIKHITQVQGSVKIVSGMAGTGKSFMLDVARTIWESERFEVRGLALAGKAAKGLEDSAKIPSQTIYSFLMNLKETKKTINKNTILVVDEAGMVGTKQMLDLVKLTQDFGIKLVLVGDAKQLQPIEAGGPFKALAKILGEATLKNIIRQRDAWSRDAVHSFSQGNSFEALKEFAKRNLLKVEEDRAFAITRLISEWKVEGIKNPENHLILAGTNLDVYELNNFAQLERGLEGAITRNYIKLERQKFFENDRIVFTKNSMPVGVKNGDIATILKINGNKITAQISKDHTVTFDIEKYDNIKLGYCITTHKAQGVTTPNSYILLGGSMQDRELSYVQASRAKETTKLYTDRLTAGDELADLVYQMSKSHQKDLALTKLHLNTVI